MYLHLEIHLFNIKNKNTDSYRVVTEGRLALEELLKLMDEENQS